MPPTDSKPLKPLVDWEKPIKRLINGDPFLRPYEETIKRRILKIIKQEKQLTQEKLTLSEFSSGHEYFGLHFVEDEWVFREWAPNASAVYLVGDFTNWREDRRFALEKLPKENVWEIRLPKQTLRHKDLYRLVIHWPGGKGNRIPAYARRVIQDRNTLIFNAQVWRPVSPYLWKYDDVKFSREPLFIYEAHVGMAQEEEKISSYEEFTEKILPKIVESGYNTLQLMAIQEHPYYGSFGYQVSNFFAPSSRFGTPDQLKELIDEAHGSGIRVIMDLIHSHGVKNEVEGLSRFDGTYYQYFHEGPKGNHNAWDSRCFDYGKYQVLHFLLSNCRYWLDEFHFDGFRFDGITSMLYFDHGLGRPFTSYDDYFNENVDEQALAYLALANKVIHDVRPDAVTIAEDISGMPGLATPKADGGIGFDYRFAMGISDYWIKLIKEFRDEKWSMGHLWYELTNRRHDEKTISYAESHDQALVGDQSLIFRLMGSDMYAHMRSEDPHLKIDRGMALHKLIRFITLMTSGNGYLNFMGNEFGHPEWIDFPREGNKWSYHYARRQWHLVEDKSLKYHFLQRFDRDMIFLAKKYRILEHPHVELILENSKQKVIVFKRAGFIFVFNLHPNRSYVDYMFGASPGKYQMIFDSDSSVYGGQQRLTPNQFHFTIPKTSPSEDIEYHLLSLYIPSRTALVLKLEA